MPFMPRKAFYNRCFPCWMTAQGAVVKASTASTDWLRAELGEHFGALIQLTHPDRHANSDLATGTTQWLLALRSKLKATP